LKESQSANLPLFSFVEFNALIGFEEVWAFERKWARVKTSAAGE
jgi:hypothetical protein